MLLKKRITQDKRVEKNKRGEKTRELGLDLLKGIAVILMLAAHSIAFFHDGSSSLLENIQKIGDTLCFTIFLFSSGASVYLAYLKHTVIDDSNLAIRILNRTARLLLAYYGIAVISTLHNFPDTYSEIIKYFFNIIFFRNIPGYTEFIIPFIVFSLLVIPFKKLLKLIANSAITSFFAGAILFFAGLIIYKFSSDFPYKVLLSGKSDQYSFPILQYSIVFFMGLSWGKWLVETKAKYKRRNLAIISSIAFLLLLLALQVTSLDKNVSEISLRWPPSFSFITIGLFASYLLSSITEIDIPQTGKFAFPTKIILFTGKNIFNFYIIHIVLLQLYSLVSGRKFDNPVIPFTVFIIIFAASYSILRYLSVRKKASTKKSSKKQASTLIFTLLILLFLSFGILRAAVYAKENKDENSNQNENRQSDIEPITPEEWWDNQYSWRTNISIVNESEEAINSDAWLTFTFDHASFVEKYDALPAGNDLRLVYSLSNSSTDLPIKISDPNTEHATITFNPSTSIDSDTTDSNYYLYFGNMLAVDYTHIDEFTNSETVQEYEVSMSDAERHPDYVSTNRIWYLKGKEILKEESNIRIDFQPSDTLEKHIYNYEILGTTLKGQLIEKYNLFQADISTETLSPGIYKLQIVSADNEIESNIAVFKVSYPLYVLWTMDWEGYDCNQTYLDQINEISAKHSVPITNFYNPRIYVGLSANRQDYLDNWIKDRQAKYGDEVELHLHFFHDMVAAAGVEVKTEPKWTDYTDGKDVLATAYTTEEMETILEWAIQKFNERGFGTPIAYRSGAWYADTTTLQALENTGFLIDSSGRQKYAWGKNQVPGYWDLQTTTHPYKPSKLNQNTTGSPSFDLWEFPNNGADSWTYSGDQMISRFNDNYQGVPITERQAVTFLSHPHGFNVDSPKMDQVFTFINQFLYSKDSGPVKYVTLEEAFAGWSE